MAGHGCAEILDFIFLVLNMISHSIAQKIWYFQAPMYFSVYYTKDMQSLKSDNFDINAIIEK